ncbi:glycosyltransferase family 1 protein [Pseudoalteromonas sp. S554]|uniref:glycosyltransferase family 1 protein n=1 Tax=Pseudoalteromonas sp. S554 TaxID=2066516 RepID=UPI00110CBB25|nr:glycosyltransferase family 1 protein [Pseudoalteromonas sp. S554]TMS82386.1 hypothetical protein CWB65_05170 [Pseudoalteromonas sp. S554]
MSNKRLLFIPVSSPEGIGEYMRSLLLANGLLAEFAGMLDIHFILNKHTTYADVCPFDTTLLESSATKEVALVCDFITAYKPDVVVFDCAGRAAHMKAAKEVGAKVVFISQHEKKRAKGLKLNRANLIDVHWVVQPDYCIAPLSWVETTKLDMFPLAHPRNVGPFVTHASEEQKKQVLNKYGLEENNYLLVNAGSGGHTFNNLNCADTYFDTALKAGKKTGLKTVVVFGSNYTKILPKTSEIICLTSLEGTDFLALLSQAKLALLSAGDTLLQAIALQTPVIACAISKDQHTRLENCVNAGVAIKASLNPDDIVSKIEYAIDDRHYEPLLAKYRKLESPQSYSVITSAVKNMLAGSRA